MLFHTSQSYTRSVLQKLASALLVLSFISFSNFALAQEEIDPTSQMCPVHTPLVVSFEGFPDDVEIGENMFSGSLLVSNDTPYIMSGVRLAIAVYSDSDSTVPSYWAALDQVVQILPREVAQVNFEIDPAALAMGSYTVRAFAMQGGVVDLLGSVIENHDNSPVLGLTKNTAQTDFISVKAIVNEEEVEGTMIYEVGDGIDVDIRTENNNTESYPLIDIVAVITRGVSPLGAAVVTEFPDKSQFIPGGHRITQVSYDPGRLDFTHSIYGALTSGSKFLPITSVLVTNDDVESGGVWPYFSRIGIADSSNDEGVSESAACVDYTGFDYSEDSGFFLDSFQGLTGFSYTVSKDSQRIASETFYSDELMTSNYFPFTIQSDNPPFGLILELLTPANSIETASDDFTVIEKAMRDSMSPSDVVSLSYACVGDGECVDSSESEETTYLPVLEEMENNKESFWFYLGITLAAALLMYLVLLRLDVGKKSPEEEIDSNELQ